MTRTISLTEEEWGEVLDGLEIQAEAVASELRKTLAPTERVGQQDYLQKLQELIEKVRRKDMLTTEQRLAAEALLEKRPNVVPGSRAILDGQKATQWHDKVVDKMKELKVEGAEAVQQFCDAAGVAD